MKSGCIVSCPLLNPIVPPSDVPLLLSPWCLELLDLGGEAGLEKKHLLFGLDNKQTKTEKKTRERETEKCVYK